MFAEIARVALTPSYIDTAVLSGATYCYRVRAFNAVAFSDYSNVACSATAASGGTFSDDFNRPDATALGNGWTSVAGSLAIQAHQARSAKARTMNTAVQAGLSGASETVSASFASLDNNLGPRFSLLVRYQDPENYYACYRQTGGSSTIRIARVVQGVETVLKMAAVSNPPIGQLFSLGCQVQGTAITLTYGSTRLTAVDAVLATGSVGMSLGYPVTGTGSAASHIADNFKATVQ